MKGKSFIRIRYKFAKAWLRVRNALTILPICIRNYFFVRKYPFWKLTDTWYDFNTSVKDRRKGSKRFTVKYSHTWYDDISHGWQVAFGKQLSKELLEVGLKFIGKAKEDGTPTTWPDILSFMQIKQKWGWLEMYASAIPEIEHVLEKYHFMSTFYCEECGRKSKYLSDGWVQYLCKRCFDRKMRDRHRRYEPDLKVDDYVRSFEYRCSLSGKDRVPHVSRYSNDDGWVPLDIEKEYGISFKELMSDD